MESVVAQQFLNFFQDFINLCQIEWPDNTTKESEIRNVFTTALHIEKCLIKLQKCEIITEFISALNFPEDSSAFIKYCFVDPPKYILKKIICSDTQIITMDIGVQVFIELIGEDRLEACLTDFMVEAASKETLLRHLKSELPKDKILILKSQLLLTQILSSDNKKEVVTDLLNNCTDDILQLLVIILNNREIIYKETIDCIAGCFLDVMLGKHQNCQKFWRSLFNIEEEYLINMCVSNSDLFTYIVEALLDCGKLISENISAELFHINLSYTELKRIVQMILKNECLKDQFVNIMKDSNASFSFWEKIM